MPAELIGITGALLFATCGVPQAIKVVREGNSDGLATGFLIMVSLAASLSLIYTLMLDTTWGEKLPYLINFGWTHVNVGIYWRYKLWPRRDIMYHKETHDTL